MTLTFFQLVNKEVSYKTCVFNITISKGNNIKVKKISPHELLHVDESIAYILELNLIGTH